MKKAVYFMLAACLAISVCGCISGLWKYKANPDPALAKYDGEIKAPSMKGTAHIYRTEYGVPHFYADNDYDLFFAIGYAQAQDRLFQMVLFRAVAEGRTAELFGKMKIPGASFKGFPIDTMVIDRQQRTMGMKFVGEAGAALLEEYDPEVYETLQAYSDGVNHYIDTHDDWKELPVEFQILKVKPEKWRPADVVSFGRLMGFILSYNMLVELWRYGMITRHGEKIGWEVAGIHDHYGPTVVPTEYLHNKLDKPREGLPPGGRPSVEEMGYELEDLAEAMKGLYITTNFLRNSISADLPFASNSWAVGPSMTTTGTAMLENDTHLPHMEPAMWYMSQVKGGSGYNSYGVMFPGIPYHPLGHTPWLSWSATTSIADVQDLYVEKVDDGHPGQYFHDGQWKDFFTRKEIIKVRQTPSAKRFKEVEVKIRQTVHGPVMTDFLPLPEESPPVTLRWTAWDFSRDTRIFDALVTSKDVLDFMSKVKKMDNVEVMNIAQSVSMLMKGKSYKDFEKAMRILDVPSQNWTCADADGNIMYLPGGFLPNRKNGVGAMPAPGTGEFDWDGFIPITEHPQMLNPKRGYIASANNEVVDAEWYPHIFDLNYDGGWRAWRVEELLQELAPIDMADMKRIQNDVYAKKAEIEVPMVLAAVENKGALSDPRVKKGYDLLKDWDYETDVDALAPAVFYRYVERMRYNVFADEVGEEDFETFLSESHADISVEMLMKHGESFLFDDVNTPDVVEDMDDMIVRSLRDSVIFLEDKYGKDVNKWRWGEVHMIKFFHPLGFGPFKDLSVGPYEMPGSRMVIRNSSPAESGKWHFKDMSGPAVRHLIDMGDPENAQMVIAGSISGQYLSPHYRDMHGVWVDGKWLKAEKDRAVVEKEAIYHLVIKP